MSIIVYTAIFGNCDSLKPAPAGADRCVCFTDDISQSGRSNGWELVHQHTTTPRRSAWHLRCVPHLLFKYYQRVVWVDASFTLHDLPKLLRDAGDGRIAALRHPERLSPYHEGLRLVKIGQSELGVIERQIKEYRQDKFHPTHLSISGVLVRDRSKAVRRFNETWDAEINRHQGDNTQVSLDYSAWKHGLTIKALEGSHNENPYATHDKRDHKLRRKPYAQAVA